jgi:hypothetical protein
MRLALSFPGLRDEAWDIESPKDRAYNCIGWAAGRIALWWPGRAEDGFAWPDGSTDQTADIFEAGFATLGYVRVERDDLSHEPGWEKVAIYANAYGTVEHMARQLSDGRWTSKMGVHGNDIVHATPLAVAGGEYGKVVRVLKRRYD